MCGVKHENHQPVGAFKVRGGVNLVSQLSAGWPARSPGAKAGSGGTEDAGAEREARNVLAWFAGTNTSDDAIKEIARAASYLAEAHTRVAAGGQR
jgi:hypothetical protein